MSRVDESGQHLCDRLLHQTIHHRRNAQLPLTAIRFRDLHPAYRLRLIAAIEQAPDQLRALRTAPRLQRINGHPVHAWSPAIRHDPLIRQIQIRSLTDHLHQRHRRQASGRVRRRDGLRPHGFTSHGYPVANESWRHPGIPGATALLLHCHRVIDPVPATRDSALHPIRTTRTAITTTSADFWIPIRRHCCHRSRLNRQTSRSPWVSLAFVPWSMPNVPR